VARKRSYEKELKARILQLRREQALKDEAYWAERFEKDIAAEKWPSLRMRIRHVWAELILRHVAEKRHGVAAMVRAFLRVTNRLDNAAKQQPQTKDQT
jgi:hypothetical protein